MRLILQNADDQNKLVTTGLVKQNAIRLVRGAGVDPDLYRLTNTAIQPPLIVLPARLLREKGVREFVEAARMLIRRGVKARFALVGIPDPANPASVSQKELQSWIDDGVVEYWGWRDDMPNVLAQCQIVCLPSYHEGLPRSILEAAASGCAIVATDIPGCREIVRHNETGLLVPWGSAGAASITCPGSLPPPIWR